MFTMRMRHFCDLIQSNQYLRWNQIKSLMILDPDRWRCEINGIPTWISGPNWICFDFKGMHWSSSPEEFCKEIKLDLICLFLGNSAYQWILGILFRFERFGYKQRFATVLSRNKCWKKFSVSFFRKIFPPLSD